MTLGSERFRCNPLILAGFRAKLQHIHPRCLMVFKANTLINDDLEICGADELPFSLDSLQNIVFDGINLELSYCAEVFLEKLPSVAEVKQWLNEAQLEWTAEEQEWLSIIEGYHQRNYDAVLIKED